MSTIDDALPQAEEPTGLTRRRVLALAAATPVAAPVALAAAAPADAAARVIGTISIPRIGLRRSIYSDALDATLMRRGVGLYRGSATPGQNGIALIFGHRTTHGGAFRRTNELRKGDKVVMVGHTYTVHSVVVVPARGLRAALKWKSGAKSATLISCSKRDGTPTSTSYRLLVRLTG